MVRSLKDLREKLRKEEGKLHVGTFEASPASEDGNLRDKWKVSSKLDEEGNARLEFDLSAFYRNDVYVQQARQDQIRVGVVVGSRDLYTVMTVPFDFDAARVEAAVDDSGILVVRIEAFDVEDIEVEHVAEHEDEDEQPSLKEGDLDLG